MNYGKIKYVDIANGTGCRVSLFVSGCSHHCKGCFNQELWDYEAGELFTPAVMMDIMKMGDHDYISGLSVLGGEPLDPKNVNAVTELCRVWKRRFPFKSIWLYTGYDFLKIKNLPVMKYLDVVVDGEFVQDLYDPKLSFRGSSNQNIIIVQNR